MKQTTKICSLIVSYNPNPEIIENIETLSSQVNKIIVVDNDSSPSDTIDTLRLLSSTNTIRGLFNEKNLGIAAALNQGLEIAIQEGYEWIATFDQDTKIPPNYIKSLLDCYDRVIANENVAIMCPMYVNKLSSNEQIIYTENYHYLKCAMTSGSLMKVSAVKYIGIFDQYLFIDWVDIDYCIRTRLANYKIVGSTNTILIHSPGNVTNKSIFGLRIITSNHSVLRRYYLYRNRVIGAKRYIGFDPDFLIRDILIGIKDFIKIILFEESRKSKILAIGKGILDGFFYKSR